MEFIRCAECKARISDHATKCPRCGAPRTKPKGRAWILVSVLVLVAGAAVVAAAVMYRSIQSDRLMRAAASAGMSYETLEELAARVGAGYSWNHYSGRLTASRVVYLIGCNGPPSDHKKFETWAQIATDLIETKGFTEDEAVISVLRTENFSPDELRRC